MVKRPALTEPPQPPEPMYLSAYRLATNPAILAEFTRADFLRDVKMTKRQIAVLNRPLPTFAAAIRRATQSQAEAGGTSGT